MDGILGNDEDEEKVKVKEKNILKKPSSANRRFDRADELGEDRTGESRDPQKACVTTSLFLLSLSLYIYIYIDLGVYQFTPWKTQFLKMFCYLDDKGCLLPR
jgi:hypothetical protein